MGGPEQPKDVVIWDNIYFLQTAPKPRVFFFFWRDSGMESV